jgi:hypothetical protein
MLAQWHHGDSPVITLAARQLEFLPTGITPDFGPGGVLIVHAEMSGSLAAEPHLGDHLPVKELASAIKDLARPSAGELPGASQLVSGWGLSLDPGPEIVVAVNVTLTEATLRALHYDHASDQTWQSLSCWNWSLARGTIPTAGALRNPTPPATPGRTVLLPRRQAIVDRSGMAIMATNPIEEAPDVANTLYNFIPVFQSIYIDVLALGFLQLLVTAEVGARLDALIDPVNHPYEFHRIETRMQLLNNRVWRIRVTGWPWLNQMLRFFQEENDLPTIIGQLNQNIRDFGNQIERKYQHGLNVILLLLGALGFVGVVAGVFATVAAIMTVFGTGHWGAVVGIIATSVGVLTLVGGASLLMRRGVWRDVSCYLRR